MVRTLVGVPRGLHYGAAFVASAALPALGLGGAQATMDMDREYWVRPGSPMYAYVANRVQDAKWPLTLRFVGDIFHKEIMNHGRLRDLGNSGMVWCDYAMERALDQRVIHVSQLGRLLQSKLERAGEQEVTLSLGPSPPSPVTLHLCTGIGPAPESSRRETELILDRASGAHFPGNQAAVIKDGKTFHIPIEQDGSICMEQLRTAIPGACGLRFRVGFDQWQAVESSGGRLSPPSWRGGVMVAIMAEGDGGVEPGDQDCGVGDERSVVDPPPMSTMYAFNHEAPLKQYLINKMCSAQRYYSMQDILQIIQDACLGERLADMRNSHMVLCSADLEHALDRKAFHTADCHDLVLCQVTPLRDQALRDKPVRAPGEGIRNRPDPPQRVLRRVSLELWDMVYKSPWTARFTLRPLFAVVASHVREAITGETKLLYREVVQILADYLEKKRTDLYDHREPRVAIVKGDALGDAFEVDAFHHRQAETLLLTQLLPIKLLPAVPVDGQAGNQPLAGELIEPWFGFGDGDTDVADNWWTGKQWGMRDPDPTILVAPKEGAAARSLNLQSPTHRATVGEAWQEIVSSERIILDLNINAIGFLATDQGAYYQEVVPPIEDGQVFCVRQHLHNLLQPYLPSREISGMYRYDEINGALQEYLRAKCLWDERNPEVAVVNRDPIGAVIGMGAMLKGTDVIRAHLEPVNATGQGWRLLTEYWVATHPWGSTCPTPPPTGFTWQRIRGPMDFQRQIDAGKLVPTGNIWTIRLGPAMAWELPTRWGLCKARDSGLGPPEGRQQDHSGTGVPEDMLQPQEGREASVESDVSSGYDLPESDSDGRWVRFPGLGGQEDTGSDPQSLAGAFPAGESSRAGESDWADEEDPSAEAATVPSRSGRKCQMCNQESGGVTHCTICWKRKRSLEPAHPAAKRRKGVRGEELPGRDEGEQGACILCCAREANTGFVHGRTTHVFSCYFCARTHWKRSNRCPVCNRQIEKIVKVIAS